LLDNETWTQTDVPSEFQELANQLTRSPSQSDLPLAQFIMVENKKYSIVNSAMILLKIILEYLKCLALLPSLNPEILQRLTEILGIYNSRTCQLILGAGALQMMNFKSITVKHLCLAFQSIGMIAALIPHMKRTFEDNMPASKQSLALVDFERITKDYSNHQNEILQKFAAIIRERVNFYSKDGKVSLKSLWTDEAMATYTSPSKPIALLIKETSIMYKVLDTYLPPDKTKVLYQNILSSFSTRLISLFPSVSLTTNAGKQNLLNDIVQLNKGITEIFKGVDSNSMNALELHFKQILKLKEENVK